jgi:hypothetical protein
MTDVLPGTIATYAETISRLTADGVESSQLTRVVDGMEPFMNVFHSIGNPATSAIDGAFPGSSAAFGAITWAFRASQSSVDGQRHLAKFLQDEVVTNLRIIDKMDDRFASDDSVRASIVEIFWDVLEIGITAAEILKDPRKRAKITNIVKESSGWSPGFGGLERIYGQFKGHLATFDRALAVAGTKIPDPRDFKEDVQGKLGCHCCSKFDC